MSDAGEVIAKVVVEYDGAGLGQAKSDMATLGETGSALGAHTGGLAAATDQLGAFDAVAVRASDGMVTFTKATEGGVEQVKFMGDSIYGVVDAQDKLQRSTADSVTAVGNMSSAGTDLNKVFTDTHASALAANSAWEDSMLGMSKSTQMAYQSVIDTQAAWKSSGWEPAFRPSESVGMMDLMRGFDRIMMPLMYAQYGAMMVQQLGQSIYDAAVIAEGPAAHGFTTFTGQIDLLGQHAATTWQQFSEGLGQGFMPTLQAMNYQAQQAPGGGVSPAGNFFGQAGSLISSLWQIGTGMNPVGGFQGLANQVAGWLGLPAPFQGTPTTAPGAPFTGVIAGASGDFGPAALPPGTYAYGDPRAPSAPPGVGPGWTFSGIGPSARWIPPQTGTQQVSITPYGPSPTWGVDYPTTGMQQGRLPPPSGGPLQDFFGAIGNLFSGGPGGWWDQLGGWWQNITHPRTTDPSQLQALQLGMPSLPSSAWAGIFPPSALVGIGQQLSESFSGIQLPHIDLSGIASSLSGTFSGIQLPHIDLSGITSGLSGAFSGISLPHLDLSGIMSSISGAFSSIQLPSISLPSFSGITSQIASWVSSLNISLPSITLPSFSGIASQIASWVSSLNISLPSISLPSFSGIASQIASWVSSLNISLPSITFPSFSGIASQVMNWVNSLNISLPSIHLPDFSNIASQVMNWVNSLNFSLPSISLPDVSGIFSRVSSWINSIHIPGFAGGVQNFHGGLAVVGEGGPELLNLPPGSSVYPMDMGGGYAAPSFLSGGSSGITNIYLSIDGRDLIAAIGPALVGEIRLNLGVK